MDFLSSIILAFLSILILISSALFVLLRRKYKEEFADTVIDKVSSLINSKMSSVTGQCESGPWYLVVYTKDSNYPIWISNNNIRSVHPGPELCNIIVKQFNGEDMVIENVINYELCSASEMCDYDF